MSFSMLIFAPNWIGDAVMATPLFRSIKKQLPQIFLTVIARTSICDLLQGLKYIDELIPLPEKSILQMYTCFQLRKRNYSTAIILPHSFRSALLSFLTRAKIRIGYDCNSRQLLLTHRIPFPQDEKGNRKIQYMTYEYLKLGEMLNFHPDNEGLELAVSQQEEDTWKQELTDKRVKGPLIGIAPGASFGPSKRWDIERFVKVAIQLEKEYNAVPILLTGPDEKDLQEHFLKKCPLNVINPFSRTHTLSRLKAVIKNLDLLICNDSGPRHIAVAFGVPVVCIMGPTKPEYTNSPWERGAVVRVPVECGPCQLAECPTDHRCMKLITPQLVIEQAEKIIQSNISSHSKGKRNR